MPVSDLLILMRHIQQTTFGKVWADQRVGRNKRSALRRMSIVIPQQRIIASRPIERIDALFNQTVERRIRPNTPLATRSRNAPAARPNRESRRGAEFTPTSQRPAGYQYDGPADHFQSIAGG